MLGFFFFFCQANPSKSYPHCWFSLKDFAVHERNMHPLSPSVCALAYSFSLDWQRPKVTSVYRALVLMLLCASGNPIEFLYADGPRGLFWATSSKLAQLPGEWIIRKKIKRKKKKGKSVNGFSSHDVASNFRPGAARLGLQAWEGTFLFTCLATCQNIQCLVTRHKQSSRKREKEIERDSKRQKERGKEGEQDRRQQTEVQGSPEYDCCKIYNYEELSNCYQSKL